MLHFPTKGMQLPCEPVHQIKHFSEVLIWVTCLQWWVWWYPGSGSVPWNSIIKAIMELLVRWNEKHLWSSTFIGLGAFWWQCVLGLWQKLRQSHLLMSKHALNPMKMELHKCFSFHLTRSCGLDGVCIHWNRNNTGGVVFLRACPLKFPDLCFPTHE